MVHTQVHVGINVAHWTYFFIPCAQGITVRTPRVDPRDSSPEDTAIKTPRVDPRDSSPEGTAVRTRGEDPRDSSPEGTAVRTRGEDPRGFLTKVSRSSQTKYLGVIVVRPGFTQLLHFYRKNISSDNLHNPLSYSYRKHLLDSIVLKPFNI